MKTPVYRKIASLAGAVENCRKNGNEEWLNRHMDKANELVRNYLPSGSGFDSGTALNWDRSTSERLVFDTAFHHMDENGYYDGWTEHEVIVKPSLQFGFTLRITGRDRNEWKEYAYDTFDHVLSQEIEF